MQTNIMTNKLWEEIEKKLLEHGWHNHSSITSIIRPLIDDFYESINSFGKSNNEFVAKLNCLLIDLISETKGDFSNEQLKLYVEKIRTAAIDCFKAYYNDVIKRRFTPDKQKSYYIKDSFNEASKYFDEQMKKRSKPSSSNSSDAAVNVFYLLSIAKDIMEETLDVFETRQTQELQKHITRLIDRIAEVQHQESNKYGYLLKQYNDALIELKVIHDITSRGKWWFYEVQRLAERPLHLSERSAQALGELLTNVENLEKQNVELQQANAILRQTNDFLTNNCFRDKQLVDYIEKYGVSLLIDNNKGQRERISPEPPSNWRDILSARNNNENPNDQLHMGV